MFIQFFARSLPVLVVGEILGGLILGTYAVIAPTYASEVCPIALRGILTSYVNLCFVMGQLLANGIIAGTSQLGKKPLGIQRTASHMVMRPTELLDIC